MIGWREGAAGPDVSGSRPSAFHHTQMKRNWIPGRHSVSSLEQDQECIERNLTLAILLSKGSALAGAAEEEMVRQHHRLNGQESEQTPGYSEGQRAWRTVVHGLDTTKELNDNDSGKDKPETGAEELRCGTACRGAEM